MPSLQALADLPFVRTPLKLARSFRAFIERGFASSGLLSFLYYVFFSRAFDRETRAVLSGKARFNRLARTDEGSRAILRRNIHRLEKGLSAREPKKIFGADYIEETVKAFAIASGACSGRAEDEELSWFHAVLDSYFDIVGTDNRRVEAARSIYRALALHEEPRPLIPYKRSLGATPPVTFESFLALTQQRRSVRSFLDTPVPHELLDQALLAASQSPSACNRQPFEFRIFDDPESIRKLASYTVGAKDFGAKAPVLIVIVGRLRKLFDERDRHVIYVDASLAAMSFMLALETLGLSSCPINWPDIESNERRMAAFLRLDADERPIMLMAVGYPEPEGKVAYSQKKSPAELRRFN